MYFYHKAPYEAKFGSVIRMITDIGDHSKVIGAFDTGLEQRATRPHRIDFVDKFIEGKYMEMPTGKHETSVKIGDKPILKVTKKK